MPARTPPTPAGYSPAPLIQKLGIKSGFRAAFVNEPADFSLLLGELPERVELVSSGRSGLDCIVLFARSSRDLRHHFSRRSRMLKPTGMIWVAWPKKSSGVATDLDENVVRKIGLDAGLVDVKVCAIDPTWSGLKFVIRLKDRPGAPRHQHAGQRKVDQP